MDGARGYFLVEEKSSPEEVQQRERRHLEMRALAGHIPDQFRFMIFNHQDNRALIQTANPG